MDFITDDDLDKISTCAGQEVNDDDFEDLKQVYLKLEYLCKELQKKGFEYTIRKDPRKQAGPGMFKFQHYQWAKIYPPGFKQICDDKFSYILALSDVMHFHMMGIKRYQELPPSKTASNLSWTEIDINTSDYDSVVRDFFEFDKKYRKLFIDSAIKLGITQLLPFQKKYKMEKFQELLDLKKQIILQGPPGTGKTYTAKDIAEQLIFEEITSDKKEQKNRLEKTDQFKLIQFHPAYSYEDFVRGIAAKPKGEFVEYKSENKTLGIFAAEAHKNYLDSKKDTEILSKEQWLNDMFEDFKDLIQTDLDNSGKYSISDSAHIYEIDDASFRYTGDKWGTKFRMPFSDIFKLYNLNIMGRKEIKTNPEISGRTKQHATYFFNLLQAFRQFLSGKSYNVSQDSKVGEKKYILIIDEINRANLPAVLGELIYALEYRGEKVDSMYEIDDDYSLVLPPNLFIIGTMNTADRSVGHIDYAIRRRFAFVDIEPSSGIINEVVPIEDGLRDKALKLFADVASFFTTEKMASDFKAKDIQLGHSYFLAKNINDLSLKLEFEIKPLLKEYIKDGILISVKNENGVDLTEQAIDDLNIG